MNCLPFIVYGKLPYYKWPERPHSKVTSKTNSKNILSTFMKQSRLFQIVIWTWKKNFQYMQTEICSPEYFQIHEIGNLFFIHSHLNRVSKRCWESSSVDSKLIYSPCIIFIYLTIHAMQIKTRPFFFSGDIIHISYNSSM